MRKTNFDFMGMRAFYLGFFVLAVLLSIAAILTRGIVRSVEFTGGAGMILRYTEAPDLESVRKTLTGAGMTGVTVTTFGDTQGKELSIRVGLGEQRELKAGEKDLAMQIVDALTPVDVRQKVQSGLLNLNVADQATIEGALRSSGVPAPEAASASTAITEYRRTHAGVIGSLDDVRALPSVPAAAKEWTARSAFVGPFGLRGQELIEAAVSREMQSKALWATVGALAGMLVYLGFRFRLRFGVAAVVALTFDVVFTLGLFATMGYEFNLPVVAAFLTLVGYSANDKVVIFDRIRETIRAKGSAHLFDVINESLNDVLSRTIITGICTIACTLALYFFGGSVLEGFAFVLLAGILIGTYSSIFVACPFALWWVRMVARREQATEGKVKANRPGGRPEAKPVRR
jgi:preprotein translocase subunit SecF